MEVRRYAGVVALDGGRVALVLERHSWWGGAFWNLPSGRVEPHETPEQGASRELLEETGLVSSPEAMTLVSTASVAVGRVRSLAWNHVTGVREATLAPADPDGHVLEARWFAVDEAVHELARLPYRPLAEPAVAYLSGSVDAGMHWNYADADAEPVVTAHR